MSQLAHNLVHRPGFSRVVLTAILLAGVLAGLETSAAIRAAYAEWLRLLNASVLLVFIAEILLKLAAEGRQPWRFFHNGWNVFDFAIVVVCCLPFDSGFAVVLRLARALRILRLVTALPKLQLLTGALLKSLRSMGYVSLLLGLLFYVYGVAGVHLFGQNDPLHFGTLGTAMITLFRVVTLENWGTIFDLQYHGSSLAPAPLPASVGAVPDPQPEWAVVYFISFIFIGTMIMLNLFIGIIMNSMSEMHREIEAAEAKSGPPADGHEKLLQEIRRLQQKVDALAQAHSGAKTKTTAKGGCG